MSPEVQRRVSLAVRAGEAVTDPADAPAAVELARLAQRRLAERTLPVTISTGVHPAALAAGVGVGVLLFSVILLLGRRQLRLARRAEQRNLRLLEDEADDGG